MAKSERQGLLRQIEQVLLPALQAAGFDRLPLEGEDANSPDIRTSFPFGRFRRRHGAVIDQIEVQLDKREIPAFRLNFGRFAAEGLQHATGHVAAADVWVHYLPAYNTLYDSGWRRHWFQCPPARESGQETCKQVVERVVSLLPEVERAFDPTQRLGWMSSVHRVRA